MFAMAPLGPQNAILCKIFIAPSFYPILTAWLPPFLNNLAAFIAFPPVYTSNRDVKFIGKNRALKQVLTDVEQVAATGATVPVLGETWHLEDALYLTTGGIIAGADALSSIKTGWADPILWEIDSWKSTSDDTTLSRIFKVCWETEVTDLQRLNHNFRIFSHSRRSFVVPPQDDSSCLWFVWNKYLTLFVS